MPQIRGIFRRVFNITRGGNENSFARILESVYSLRKLLIRLSFLEPLVAPYSFCGLFCRKYGLSPNGSIWPILGLWWV